MKHVCICLNSVRRGGVEMAAINFQKYADKEKYRCSYYIRSCDDIDKELETEILSNDVEVIYKPEEVKSRFSEYRYLKVLMKNKGFDVVHSHMQYHSGLVMLAAYKANVKKRIAHSHFTQNNRKINLFGKIYRKCMRLCINRFATDKLACTPDAGDFLYGQAFEYGGKVIGNGIDMSKYVYDKEKREKVRKELNIEAATLAVGHIGSVYEIKNQIFLIKIFNSLHKIKQNTVLILCGEIRDDGKAQNLVKELGLEQCVKFLGVRSDIPELLMAMDVLIFPSLFEALPIVPIEAQATGLPCLLSDRIVSRIKQNDNVEYMPLESPPEEWAEKAIELAKCDRENISTAELEKNYDIKNVAKQLEMIYGE